MSVIVAQRGVRINLEVRSDEAFAIGNSVHLITYTTVLSLEDVGIGIGVSFGRRGAMKSFGVIEGTVGRFVIVLYTETLVVWRGAVVTTPLGIDRHDSVAVAALLGGYHDDTVGTTRTIDGVGCGIFLNANALDVHRVDAGEGTVVWHTVDDDQRTV